MIGDKKKDKLIDYGWMAALFLAVIWLTGQLFIRQAVCSLQEQALYPSDMKAYILEMQGIDSGYSFPYPIFFWLGRVFHVLAEPELSMALALLLLNTGSVAVMVWVLRRSFLQPLQERFEKHSYMAGCLLSAVAVSLHFVSMLFLPEGRYLPGIRFRYLGVFTANPFHNATYMAARPFAIVAFFMFVRLLQVYEAGEASKREYALFALFLLLATMTKPSFTIVLVGAAGLLMLWRLLCSRGKNLIPTIQLGICFLPTFLDLLYQYSGVFAAKEGAEGGIGLGFAEVWSLYCDNILLAVGLAVGFPLLVLVLNARELKENTLFRFSWLIYGMSLIMALLLYEKGFRKPDFNFSWGYMYGIFFAFVGALFVLLQKTADKSSKKWKLILQWAVYLWHVLCGSYYFWQIAGGATYY